MGVKNIYRTKHREELCRIFRAEKERDFTAKDIIEMTRGKIGEATVYRMLKKLAGEGVIERKYISASDGAVYRYAEENWCGCRFHLHCVNCGNVVHMDCVKMKEAEEHILSGHGFSPLDKITVIDGVCEKCRK